MTPPPRKVKVELQGEARKHQGDSIGVFTLHPELVNTMAIQHGSKCHLKTQFCLILQLENGQLFFHLSWDQIKLESLDLKQKMIGHITFQVGSIVME